MRTPSARAFPRLAGPSLLLVLALPAGGQDASKDGLRVRPVEGLRSSGRVPGPFEPAERVFDLFNAGRIPLEWEAVADEPWIRLSAVRGRLDARAVAPVVVSIDAERASALASGRYRGSVEFRDLAGERHVRSVGLDVRRPGLNVRPPTEVLEVHGPPGGPFAPPDDTR